MSKENRKEDQNGEFERPKVHVIGSGRKYVKADELFRSKRGRAMLEKMAKLDFGKNSSSSPRIDR